MNEKIQSEFINMILQINVLYKLQYLFSHCCIDHIINLRKDGLASLLCYTKYTSLKKITGFLIKRTRIRYKYLFEAAISLSCSSLVVLERMVAVDKCSLKYYIEQRMNGCR